MQPWKRIEPTINTKIDYHEVVVKTFKLPNDEITTRTTFFSEGMQAAGIIAVTKDNKIVVARQFRPGPEKVMYEIPGGHVDEGEDPESTATRELLEETGYKPGKITFLGEFCYDSSGNLRRNYYLATGCELVREQQLDHDEFVDIDLCSIEEFIGNAKRGGMSDPIAVLAAYDQLIGLQEKGGK